MPGLTNKTPVGNFQMTCKILSANNLKPMSLFFLLWNNLRILNLSLDIFNLPKKNRLLSLIKSPFIYKKTGRQFFSPKQLTLLRWILASTSELLPSAVFSLFFKHRFLFNSIHNQLAKTTLKTLEFTWAY